MLAQEVSAVQELQAPQTQLLNTAFSMSNSHEWENPPLATLQDWLCTRHSGRYKVALQISQELPHSLQIKTRQPFYLLDVIECSHVFLPMLGQHRTEFNLPI